MASNESIRPLDADTIAQIKSSINIISLNGVILELLKNSLDAQARKVEITVDYTRGNCMVEDDGIGIPPPEFEDGGGLGKLYRNVLSDSSKTLSNAPSYGTRGCFLASVASLSLVSITSHHHKHRSHNSLNINKSQILTRHCPALPQHQILIFKHGTRVSVRDLFGNMPVRVKQRAVELNRKSGSGREWEELRREVVGLVLAWPVYVNICIRDGVSGHKIQLQGQKYADSLGLSQSESNIVSHVSTTLWQGSMIPSPDSSKWVSVNASTADIRIWGVISLKPAPTKSIQFLSLGINPLSVQRGNNLLFEHINRQFDKSFFGQEDDPAKIEDAERARKPDDRRYKTDGFSSKDLRGLKRGVDRWPIFVFKIEFVKPSTHGVAIAIDDILDGRGSVLTTIVELLEAMIFEFLKSHQFRPRSMRLSSFLERHNPATAKKLSISNSTTKVAGWTKIIDDMHQATMSSGSSSQQPHPIKEVPTRILHTKPLLRSLTAIHTQKADSLFNSWSRVKVGKRKLNTPSVGQHRGSIGSVLQKEKDMVEPLESTLQSGREFDLKSNDNPTLAKSGKIIQLPFIGLPPTSLIATSSSIVIGDDERVQMLNLLDKPDGFLDWINPITNERSYVDSRTGLVVQPANNKRMTSRITHSDQCEKIPQTSILDNICPIQNRHSSNDGTSWIDGILRKWANPIFDTTEVAIPQLSLECSDASGQQFPYGKQDCYSQLTIERSFQTSSAGLAGRISKEALRQAEIISQVDKKFILIKISFDNTSVAGDRGFNRKMLVIVDQHAADERCRIEELLTELCSAPLADDSLTRITSMRSGILTTPLEKPINFTMPWREIQLLKKYSQHFADWGVLYQLPLITPRIDDQCREQRVTVVSLPPGILERCRTFPKLLIELLRSEAWRCHEKVAGLECSVEAQNKKRDAAKNMEGSVVHAWLTRIHHCPQGILDMLNSRSCRSAIMFNDQLSSDQCRALLLRLADCAFPFQCAHGRPSMIPLIDLGILHEQGLLGDSRDSRLQQSFGVAFKRWKHEMA